MGRGDSELVEAKYAEKERSRRRPVDGIAELVRGNIFDG